MKKIKDREHLVRTAEKEVDKALERLFGKLHKRAESNSGDITPEQAMELDEIGSQLASLRVRLTELIAEQVWQNKDGK